MANQNKKKSDQDIDENLLMAMMAGEKNNQEVKGGQQPEIPQPKPEVREKSRQRRTAEAEFTTLFLKHPGTNARDGKSVYIRPEFHERLTRIVQVIGEDKLTIYAYLDNILEYHFREFSEEITKNFNDKYKPIF